MIPFHYFTQTLTSQKLLDKIQRNRWLLDETAEPDSRLVESMLLRIPQAPLYCEEAEDGRIRIVQGGDRVQALVEFISGRLQISGDSHPDLAGKRHADLGPSYQEQLQSLSWTTHTLDSDVEPALRQHIRRHLSEPQATHETQENPMTTGSHSW